MTTFGGDKLEKSDESFPLTKKSRPTDIKIQRTTTHAGSTSMVVAQGVSNGDVGRHPPHESSQRVKLFGPPSSTPSWCARQGSPLRHAAHVRVATKPSFTGLLGRAGLAPTRGPVTTTPRPTISLRLATASLHSVPGAGSPLLRRSTQRHQPPPPLLR